MEYIITTTLFILLLIYLKADNDERRDKFEKKYNKAVREAAIQSLRDIDILCSAHLYNNRPDRELTMDECHARWKNTDWSRLINKRIEELEKL